MIELLISTTLALMVIAMTVSAFIRISAEFADFQQRYQGYYHLLKAQMMLIRVIRTAGVSTCQLANRIPDVLIKSSPAKHSPLRKPGKNRYLSGPILSINTNGRSALVTEPGEQLLLSNPIRTKPGRPIVISDCQNTFIQPVKKVGTRRGQQYITLAMPKPVMRHSNIAPLNHREFYQCQPGLCMYFNQRRHVIVRGISGFSIIPDNNAYQISFQNPYGKIHFKATRG